tara:strand:- start:9970 stop:10743 length:774 start_codon:yes stop_codon:yes gene_type:complete
MNLKELSTSIEHWLTDYLESSGLECFIIGVSGGIDSALVSTLCARTGKPTYIFNIPIRSEEKNTSLSSLQCEWLENTYSNVKSELIDLTETYNTYRANMLSLLEDNGLAYANTKARLRMILLYHYATTLNGLVVGTGNKVEDFGVGFYTKYGDGGVDLSPIADLTKTQVCAVAEYLGVSEAILTAPPTDGLWEDSRTDEEQIGASYEELEWAMDYLDNQRTENITARQQEVIEVFLGYRNRNNHKMVPIPVYQISED